MTTEQTGRISSPVPSPLGSDPDSQPMIGELITRPLKPQVIVKPMAVAVPCLKRLATSAIVVGNTGAIARPAQNTVMPAMVGSVVCSIDQVVMAIRTADAMVTVSGAILIRI